MNCISLTLFNIHLHRASTRCCRSVDWLADKSSFLSYDKCQPVGRDHRVEAAKWKAKSVRQFKIIARHARPAMTGRVRRSLRNRLRKTSHDDGWTARQGWTRNLVGFQTRTVDRQTCGANRLTGCTATGPRMSVRSPAPPTVRASAYFDFVS
jgi:hypothetical protein